MADEYQYNTTPGWFSGPSNSETMQGAPDWLDTGNLASYFGQGDWAPYGYNGNIWGTYANGGGDSAVTYHDLTPEAKQWLQQNNYSIRGNALPGESNYSASLWNNKANAPIKNAYYSDADPLFGALINIGVGGVIGGAPFLGGGGGLAGTLGFNGATAGAINGAATGGLISAGNDQNAFKGMLAGGLGGFAGGSNFAKDLGITNPIGAKAVNAGIGGTVGALAGGASGGDALKSGLTGGAMAGFTQGLNQMGSNVANFFTGFGGGNQGLEDLQGSGGDMSGQTDVTPSSYEDTSNVYRYAGDQSPNTYGTTLPQPTQEPGQKQASSFSMPSMGNIGNFVGNHFGDIATTLYGLYNNRKQQRSISDMMGGLQGLYGQNSPYAQQLRNKLMAQAAMKGTRSNVAGREVQLQAALADRAAQSMPALFQMQQAKGQLQNSMGSNLLGMFNKMGGIQGLQNLFNPSQGSLTGAGAGPAYQRMDDMYSNAQWTGN